MAILNEMHQARSREVESKPRKGATRLQREQAYI